MTLEEARRELGIGADADAADAKRAYLRLLKLRKPDVDPQGFQRLRAAYERVAAGGQDERAAEPPAASADLVDAALARARAIEEPSQWQEVARAFQLAAADAKRRQMPVLIALETMLLLYRERELAAALELARSVEGWLATMPSHARAFEEHLQAPYLLTRELATATELLPAELVAQIARGALYDDFEEGIRGLRAFVRREPKRAETARARLDARSPFHPVLWRHLETPSLPPPAKPAPVPWDPRERRQHLMDRVLVGVVVALAATTAVVVFT